MNNKMQKFITTLVTKGVAEASLLQPLTKDDIIDYLPSYEGELEKFDVDTDLIRDKYLEKYTTTLINMTSFFPISDIEPNLIVKAFLRAWPVASKYYNEIDCAARVFAYLRSYRTDTLWYPLKFYLNERIYVGSIPNTKWAKNVAAEVLDCYEDEYEMVETSKAIHIFGKPSIISYTNGTKEIRLTQIKISPIIIMELNKFLKKYPTAKDFYEGTDVEGTHYEKEEKISQYSGDIMNTLVDEQLEPDNWSNTDYAMVWDGENVIKGSKSWKFWYPDVSLDDIAIGNWICACFLLFLEVMKAL